MKVYTNNIIGVLSNDDVRIVKTITYLSKEERDVDYENLYKKIQKDFKTINVLQLKENLNLKQLNLLTKLENEYSCEFLENDLEEYYIKSFDLIKANVD